MPKFSRDNNMVQECLNLMADVYRLPTFCISYRKGNISMQEFFPLSKKEDCYARIRFLCSRRDIVHVSCEFYFDLEVEKI